MLPQILAGKPVADKVKADLKAQIESCLPKKGRAPKLTIIMLGDNQASAVYVRNKTKAAESLGIISETITLPESTNESEILELISKLNVDTNVDGILVQLPLPKHIDIAKVQAAISVDKDVDGFGKEHMGACWLGLPGYLPCTAAGIMRILEHYSIDLCGKNCLIIGRSNIVAKPVAALLLQANATVTIAHSKTKQLFELSKTMDLIIVSVGKAAFLPAYAVKEGAIIVDVGINRDDTGKLIGDVDHDCYQKLAAYTPVPGGVGPLTVTELMANTVQAWLNHV